jgi:membrane associated rhomboid family serine protease
MFIPFRDANKLKHIRIQWITLVLIVANVVAWMLSVGFEATNGAGTPVFAMLGFQPLIIFDGVPASAPWLIVPEWATWITYSFIHGDFWHLAGNMLFLWVFGDNVEDAMGHFRFLIFYLLCAAAGAAGHALLDPSSPIALIGASGAISGLVSAYLILHPKVWIWVLVLMRIPVMLPAWVLLTFWAGLQVFELVTATTEGVSFAAHVGGLIAGAILVFVFKRRDVPLLDRKIEPPDAAVLAKTEQMKRRVPDVLKWGRGAKG